MRDIKRLLAETPLAVLFALPGAAGTTLALAVPDHRILVLCLVTATSVGLGVRLGHQLRHVGHRRGGFSRDIARLEGRLSADRLRLGLLEQLVGSIDRSGERDVARTRALLSQLVQAEESTRASMAAELHETVAQTLAQALQQLAAGSIAAGRDSVADAEVQLREVLARLRPPALVEGDLAEAVRDLCGELEQRYGVFVDVRWPDQSVALSWPVATTVYRFVQSALLNSVVHADGVDVRLEVITDSDDLWACVSDGGAGFDPQQVRSVAGRHIGLQLARERARLAGGALDVHSAPGAGTTVRLRLPLVEGGGRASIDAERPGQVGLPPVWATSRT